MKTLTLLSAAAVLNGLLAVPAPAVTMYATTSLRNLVSFDSAAPGTLLNQVPISGLVDPFESIQGIDFRPSNGQLYALGNAPGSIYRLYTLNTTTGVATRIGTTDHNLTGTFWGFDFNPNADLIRVVSDSGTNLRLNPNDGSAITDVNLDAAGVVGAAYDRNDASPGTPTSLFGINFNTDQLVRVGGVDSNPSPNGGVTTNIGLLGVDASGFTSFDIYSANTAYAAMAPTGPLDPNLYTINLGSGLATLVGPIGSGARESIGAMAAVPELCSSGLLGLAALAAAGRRSRRA